MQEAACAGRKGSSLEGSARTLGTSIVRLQPQNPQSRAVGDSHSPHTHTPLLTSLSIALYGCFVDGETNSNS